MLITKENHKCIIPQVEYLIGCYPQLKWDVNMTAGAWLISLTEINATEEEFINNCRHIVKKGYKDYEVNISLIAKMILEDRKDKKLKNDGQKEMQRMKQSEKASPEKIDEFMKQIREEFKNGN